MTVPQSGLRGGRRLAAARRAWLGLAGAGLAFLVAHAAFGLGGRPLDGVTGTWISGGLETLALAAVAARAARIGVERAAWALLALGIACWTAGDVSPGLLSGGHPSAPLVADAFHFAFYLPASLALVLLVRDRVSRFDASVWLDGAAAALAAASLVAAVLLDAVLHASRGKPLAEAADLAYPLGDIVLVAVVVGVFAVAGWRPGPGWLVIGGALLLIVAADGVSLYRSALGSHRAGGVPDALWPAALILLGVAAWSRPARPGGARLEVRRLTAAPLASGLIALGVLIDSYVERRNGAGVVLAAAAGVTVVVRAVLTVRENVRMSEYMRLLASTDALTGLGNRRRLSADLDDWFEQPECGAGLPEQRLVVLFDLDGFKLYNDTFGHPAGDALLVRLAGKLDLAVGAPGRCYRLGGDEFCVVAAVPTAELGRFLDRTTAALSESGEGFEVSTSFGCAVLPEEASTASEALRLADQRLYAQKSQSVLARNRPHAVLLQVLEEREPALREHVGGVAELSLRLAARLRLDGDALEELALAAQLHDIGKLAIPDAILEKTEPLDECELGFIRAHTLVGQRILEASPALVGVAKIVRASHERWDGSGYPDGLAGAEIPLPARIIAVCDAYCAMTEERPHGLVFTPAAARAELRVLAGGQFDPVLVEVFCDAVRAEA